VSQPFANQPTAPAGGPTSPASFAQPTYGQPNVPPPQKSKWWMWLLGGCGCSSILLVLCCGGVTYFGVSKGMGALGELVKKEVEDNEDIKANLGDDLSVTMNIMETASEQKARGGESNLIVFDAKGTEGEGQLIVQTSKDGQGGPFNSIELKLPDGTLKKIK